MIRFPKRHFSYSRILLKDDIKNKLGKLGKALLKGDVQASEPSFKKSQSETSHIDKPLSPLEECSEKHKNELEENYLFLIQMSEDDIAIQDHFSRGIQWGGRPPKHFLDRTAAYRSIPDKMDLLSTPWSEIKKVYDVLDELDNDKALFERAIKIANNKVPIPRNRTKQEKVFYDSCRDLRRGQDSKPLLMDQITKAAYPYNVIGFDRTIFGFPLAGAKAVSAKGEKLIPQELIEDQNSQPFNTSISPKKEYVNIVDYEVMKNCVEPHYYKPKDLRTVLKAIGKPIYVDDISNYENLGPQQLPLIETVHTEIRHLCRSLESESVDSKDSESEGDGRDLEMDLFSVLTRSDKFSLIKSGQFVLASKHQDATIQEGPTFKYMIKAFDLIPFFGMNFVTRKQYHLFYRHLFKIFMINSERQVDTLTLTKYKLPPEVKDFTRKLYGRIHNIIKNKIMPVALKHRCVYSLKFDIVLYKPMRTSSFLRFYWNRKQHHSGVSKPLATRRQSLKFKILEIARSPS